MKAKRWVTTRRPLAPNVETVSEKIPFAQRVLRNGVTAVWVCAARIEQKKNRRRNDIAAIINAELVMRDHFIPKRFCLWRAAKSQRIKRKRENNKSNLGNEVALIL